MTTPPTPPTLVRCDNCPRRVLSDTLRDIRALPARRRGERAFVCDGCAWRWHLSGALRHAERARLDGRPAAVVAVVAAKHGDPMPPARAALLAVLITRLGTTPLPGHDLRARDLDAETLRDRLRAERAALTPRPASDA